MKLIGILSGLATVVIAMGAQAQQGAPNSMPQMGGGNTNNQPGFPKEKCSAEVPNLRKLAEACLGQADFNKRKACFDQISDSKMPKGYFDSCREAVEPLKNEIMAKEKAKYPKQASALDGGGQNQNGGPNNMPGNMPGNMNNQQTGPAFPKEKCASEIPNLKKMADGCLGQADFNKRKACFDQVGEKMPKGYFDSCSQAVEPIKNEFIAKEKSKYPKQGSVLEMMNNNGPTNPGPNMQGGSPNNMPGNSGNSQMAMFPKEKCSGEIPNLRKMADGCLGQADFNKRKACFEQVGEKMPKGYFESCREVAEPLKNEYIAKEKSKYPNQASAVDSNSNSGSNNMPGAQQGGQQNFVAWPAEKCNAEIPKIRKAADNCLKVTNQQARAACFDKAGNTAVPQGFWESCRAQLEPLKAEYQAKEKAKYPNQASAVDGNKNQNQPNGGNQQSNGQQAMPNKPNVDCGKVVTSEARPGATKCLAVTARPQRKTCFDQLGEKLYKEGASEACRDQMNQLRSEIMAMEKQKYPKDEPTMN